MKKILLLSVFICLIGAGCAPTTDETNNTRTSTTPLSDTEILTEKDFHLYGFHDRKRINPTAQTFTVQINENRAPFIFHVVSLATSTNGYIEIFRNGEKTPYQRIELDPTLMFATNVPEWFTLRDINFDGFSDIGIIAEAGAKWGSYQYWIFDQTSEQFRITPLTDDLRKLTFNTIQFDSMAKQIMVDNFYNGITGTKKDTYLYQDGHLHLQKTHIKENITREDEKVNTPTPTLHCKITTKTYTNGKEHIITEELNHTCSGPFGR